jgi:predicted O-linked N-acetylglucosamine transferase (SPINDLY family)
MRPEIIFETAVQKQLSNDFDGAKLLYKKLLKMYPAHSQVLGNLATIVKREGQLEAAEMMLTRALNSDPKNVEALATLSNIRLNQRRYEDAMDIANSALAINPRAVDALINRGVAYARNGQINKAEHDFHTVLRIAPRNGIAQINLKNCGRLRRTNIQESIREFEEEVAKNPLSDDAWIFLSLAYLDNHQYVKALDAIDTAYKISNNVNYIANRASVLIAIGEFEDAIANFKNAISIEPGNIELNTTLLFALNYDDRMNAIDVFNEYKKYGDKLKASFRYQHGSLDSFEGRKIRIGYSSADFYAHVVMFFMEPIFRDHDRDRFELFAYSNTRLEDGVTERIRKYFDHWADVSNMTNREMAQQINDDKIDILVDLAGHTAGTRLEAMAYRPAPIQATYLGYGYTTGMSEIDYFIGDKNFTPDGSEPLFSEKIIRIQEPVYAYEGPNIQINPNALPALSKDYVTFGTMSRLIRLNNRMMKVWKRILDQVPNSKLRIDQKPFSDRETRERFGKRLEAIGYAPDQYELVCTNPHWLGYHHFDISLDCWPHNAGTTNFDALWMGVPVISKLDRPSVGRLSAMILEPLGCSDWVAKTEDEFVEIAVRMASDLPALANIRMGLRQKIKSSPFMDFKARTRSLEAGYMEMINRYQAENP